MTKPTNNTASSKDQNNPQDVSLTSILQAHDILLSILLGKSLAKSKDPQAMINQILEMTDIQDIDHNAKQHIKLLLQPLKDHL